MNYQAQNALYFLDTLETEAIETTFNRVKESLNHLRDQIQGPLKELEEMRNNLSENIITVRNHYSQIIPKLEAIASSDNVYHEKLATITLDTIDSIMNKLYEFDNDIFHAKTILFDDILRFYKLMGILDIVNSQQERFFKTNGGDIINILKAILGNAGSSLIDTFLDIVFKKISFKDAISRVRDLAYLIAFVERLDFSTLNKLLDQRKEDYKKYIETIKGFENTYNFLIKQMKEAGIDILDK